MQEIFAYSHVLTQQEAMPVISGLTFVFAFQVLIFRWAERSNLITATYFMATTALVAIPLAAALVEEPDRAFSIHDREVVWTVLSFLATIIGIACASSVRRQGRAAGHVGPPDSGIAHALEP